METEADRARRESGLPREGGRRREKLWRGMDEQHKLTRLVVEGIISPEEYLVRAVRELGLVERAEQLGILEGDEGVTDLTEGNDERGQEVLPADEADCGKEDRGGSAECD